MVRISFLPKGSGSIGRAPVSKTGGWGFESLLPCKYSSGRVAYPEPPGHRDLTGIFSGPRP